MKKIIVAGFLWILCQTLIAQELELNELTTPSVPAFTILDLSPTAISRPTLSKPFFMSVANSLDGKSIASDIAIETTPYWWKPRYGLSYKEYYGLDSEKKTSGKVINQIWSSASFSMATSDASPDIDTIDSRYIATGLKFQVLSGKPSARFRTTYDTIKKVLLTRRASVAEVKDRLSDMEIDSFKELYQIIDASVSDIGKYDTYLKTLDQEKREKWISYTADYIKDYIGQLDTNTYNESTIVKHLEQLRLELSDTINNILVDMQGMSRVGLLLEFAGATSLLAPTNKIDYTIGQQWAIWGNLTYRIDPDKKQNTMYDFSLLVRSGGNLQLSSDKNTDFGLSWAITGNNYSLTLEGIFRSFITYKNITAIDGQTYRVTETDNTWRFALAFQYSISDVINLSLTAGKDFENSKVSADGLFSLLNFNLDIPCNQVILIE